VHGGGARCEAHPYESSFADPRRGSRHERGYGREWDKTRQRVLFRDEGLCQPCLRRDCVTVATQVDHIVPKAENGGEEDANLQSICTPCHDEKSRQEAARARQRGRLTRG
jgi:5-methylcytosine-specific restriction protein A